MTDVYSIGLRPITFLFSKIFDIRWSFERLENRFIVIHQRFDCRGLLEAPQNVHGTDLDVFHSDFVASQLSSQYKGLEGSRPLFHAIHQICVC